MKRWSGHGAARRRREDDLPRLAPDVVVGGPALGPLHREGRRELGETLLQPDVAVGVGGHQVAPPLVGELVEADLVHEVLDRGGEPQALALRAVEERDVRHEDQRRPGLAERELRLLGDGDVLFGERPVVSGEDAAGIDAVRHRRLCEAAGVDPAQGGLGQAVHLAFDVHPGRLAAAGAFHDGVDGADDVRCPRVGEDRDVDAAVRVALLQLLELAVIEAGDADAAVGLPLRHALASLRPLAHQAADRDHLAARRHPVGQLEGRRVGEDAEVGIPAGARLDHEVLVAGVDEHRVAVIGEA